MDCQVAKPRAITVGLSDVILGSIAGLCDEEENGWNCASHDLFHSYLQRGACRIDYREVKFVDESPKAAAVKVSKDQDYCGETLPNETYLVGSDGALKNVVVFIETTSSTAVAEPQKENILNNTGCLYSPRILAMQKGEQLKVKNNDPKLHIPHSYREDRTIFNLSLPFRGTTIDATPRIRQTGVLKVVLRHTRVDAGIYSCLRSFLFRCDR